MKILSYNYYRLLLLLLMTFFTTVSPADFQRRVDAHEKGDFTTTVKEYLPIAELGNATAQYNLGTMYDKGEGVPQNYKAAIKWYTLAAEQGEADAQYSLGYTFLITY